MKIALFMIGQGIRWSLIALIFMLIGRILGDLLEFPKAFVIAFIADALFGIASALMRLQNEGKLRI